MTVTFLLIIKKRLYGGFDASVIDTNIYKYIIIIMIPYLRKYVKHRTGFFTPHDLGTERGTSPYERAVRVGNCNFGLQKAEMCAIMNAIEET